MNDPFNILDQEPDAAPRFEEAVQELVTRLGATYARFEELEAQVPQEAYTEQEWQIVERAAEEATAAAERADESYVAVIYDSHAWYRIMESLEQVERRLASAIGVMELVRDRVS